MLLFNVAIKSEGVSSFTKGLRHVSLANVPIKWGSDLPYNNNPDTTIIKYHQI